MLRTCASMIAAALLAACGGGGEGADTFSPSPESTQARTAVSILLASPSRIEAEVFPGDATPGVTLQVTASGDLDSLDGRRLYVVVEDPSSLFVSTPSTTLNSQPPGMSIGLFGRTQNEAGLKEGNLRIKACLDPSCNVELAGSPLQVPYSVNVLAGTEIDRETISVTLPFGQAPAAETVNVKLPKYLQTFTATRSTPYDPTIPSQMLVSATTTSTVTGVVTLAMQPAPVGSYTEMARIRTSIERPDRRFQFYDKEITFHYTVTPSPVDYVFAPGAGQLTRIEGENIVRFTSRRMLLNTGVTATWRGVEYLTHPPAAEGHAQLNKWWIENPGYGTSTCYNGGLITACLPVGTYTARVRYTLAKGGVDTDVYWPITLDIVPR